MTTMYSPGDDGQNGNKWPLGNGSVPQPSGFNDGGVEGALPIDSMPLLGARFNPESDFFTPVDWDTEFARESWHDNIGNMNEEIKEYAALIGEEAVTRSPDEIEPYWSSLNDIRQRCHDLLEKKGLFYGYGCSKLNNWSGDPTRRYVLPEYVVLMANSWNRRSVSDALAHETEHLKLFALKEMMCKGLLAKGIVSAESFKTGRGLPPSVVRLLKRINKLDIDLDKLDRPMLNPTTRRIEFTKESNDAGLYELIDMYNEIVRTHKTKGGEP